MKDGGQGEKMERIKEKERGIRKGKRRKDVFIGERGRARKIKTTKTHTFNNLHTQYIHAKYSSLNLAHDNEPKTECEELLAYVYSLGMKIMITVPVKR